MDASRSSILSNMAWYHLAMVAFHLPGGIPVYFYSLLISIGTFIGLFWITARASEKAALKQLEAGIWSLAGALIGGRTLYVILAWPYFQNNLSEVFLVNLGGLAWPGALAGGLVGLAFFAANSRQSFGALADDLVPLLASLAISGWLGCLIEGCAYGAPAENLGIASPDEWGVVTPRWPVQISSALLCLIAFYGINRLPEAFDDLYGLRASLMLLALAGIQFGATLFTAQSFTWRGLSLDGWAALFAAGAALVGLGMVYRASLSKR